MITRLALLLPILILAGCAASDGRPSTSATPNPTSGEAAGSAGESVGPSGEKPSAGGDELTGFLGADSIEGGCPYLETEDGTRYEVIYPPGYNIDRSNGTLRDPSGEVIASAGDVVTVRGREAKDMVSFCQIGPIFQATEVVSVE